MDPLLIPVWPDAARALGIGRTKTFELIATGAIRSVKIGDRRLVPIESIRKYVAALIDAGQKAS